MRPIDADKLRMESYEFELGDNGYHKRVVDVSDIDNAPTIDAIPVVHGHWIKYEVDIAEHPWHCSRCGWTPPKYVCHIDEMEYCNHCGAKMDEPVGISDKLKDCEKDDH